MQVQEETKILSSTLGENLEVKEEDWSIEGLIFPQILKEAPGEGQRCYYCWTKTGYSVAFTSLGQYAKHVLYQHEGYSIYVFDEDVKKYKEELAALRRKQMKYPKQFRQPAADLNSRKYCSRYSLFYKKRL